MAKASGSCARWLPAPGKVRQLQITLYRKSEVRTVAAYRSALEVYTPALVLLEPSSNLLLKEPMSLHSRCEGNPLITSEQGPVTLHTH